MAELPSHVSFYNFAPKVFDAGFVEPTRVTQLIENELWQESCFVNAAIDLLLRAAQGDRFWMRRGLSGDTNRAV